MHIEELRDYCLQKKGVEETFPFGELTLVYKVGGKIFLITSLDESNSFNAKCDPERAVELRERYNEIIPGFHMNKKHWNTVHTDGSLSRTLLHEIIDHSYEVVFESLPKKIKQELISG